MGFFDGDLIKKVINHNTESGHIPRSPTFLFNQRAAAIAHEYGIPEDDIKAAYTEKPLELKPLFESMNDTRQGKGFLGVFMSLVSVSVAQAAPGTGLIMLALSLGGAAVCYSKHKDIGKTVAAEIKKTKPADVTGPKA